MRSLRTCSLLLAVAAVAATTPPPAVAQSARDTTHVAAQQPRLDTIRAAQTYTENFCATKTARSYPTMCRAIAAAARQLVPFVSSESALLVAPELPPQLPPAPVDTTPPIDTTRPPITLDVAPELPRVYLNTAVSNTPSPGRTLSVSAGGNLQAALDSARAGDKIVVACATYRGNYVLRPRGGSATAWLTITSEAAGNEGVRASRSTTTPTCKPRLISPTVNPVLTAQGGDLWVRIIGLELAPDSTLSASNGIVELGDGSATTLAGVPSHLILDRVYVHSWPAQWVHRCISLQSASTAIIDSYVSECHADIDAQAIWGWNGPGPYKITNNYLEASTEVIGFGGADPALVGNVPSDIEIRGNHITRPMSWQGGAWLEKNLVEFKVGRRVLVEGNVLENAWVNGQLGWAFVIWSVNQQGNNPAAESGHFTIRNNVIRNTASGFQISDKYGAAVGTHDLLIANNVFVGLGNPAVPDGQDAFILSGNVPRVTIEHNTAFAGAPIRSLLFLYTGPTTQLRVANNLLGGGHYPLWISPGSKWAAAADTSSRFAGNVVATGGESAASFSFPAGNSYPSDNASVGLVGGATAATSVTATLDQLLLSTTSPFKGKATDGTDPGANVAALKAAIAGVVQP